jgi:non-ribosomal peptide synthetase component F
LNLHQATLGDPLEMFILFSSIASISGNRTQANYATGNAFQNAFAKYRQSLGLPGLAVALGAIGGIGILAKDETLLRTLARSGLTSLYADDFEKIMEATVNESIRPDLKRSLLSVGFDMFETVDGKVQAREDQKQLFWTDSPEFGFMMDHRFSTDGGLNDVSIKDQIDRAEPVEAQRVLLKAFLGCLSNLLGYDLNAFDPSSPLAVYGFDSLNAVSVRYWFFKELALDLPVFDILGCRSINSLITRVLDKFQAISSASSAVAVPQPRRNTSLSFRPLSNSQRRLWFLHRFIPDKTVYNLLLVSHIEGSVDWIRFQDAWTAFVRRHEVLHSKISDTEEGLQQIPVTSPSFSLEYVQTSDDVFEQNERSLTQIAKSHVFDLEAGELLHGWLLQSNSRCRFFLGSHHLAWDRSSMPTIFKELPAIYKALAAGRSADEALLSVPYQFIDYTLWQNECIANSALLAPQMDYWVDQLKQIPGSVSLLPNAITDSRPSLKTYNVNSVSLQIAGSLSSAVKSYCKNAALTPFMLMASALTALIHKLTRDDDIVIGIIDGDRGHSEFDAMVGFTVNMLPIRSKPRSDMAFAELVEQYRTACLGAYEHRAVPFDYLLQKLAVPRSTSHSPVSQITINYQMQGSIPQVDFGDFKFSKYDHHNARLQSDFGLDIEETDLGELNCIFDFDTSLYDVAGMENFAKRYELLLQNIVDTQGQLSLGSINVDSPADQRITNSVLQPLHQGFKSLAEMDQDLFPVLFEKATSVAASKPAIIEHSRIITYEDLRITTASIANRLIADGLQVGDRVGVYCEQSCSMVLAMYGIIAAGGAYVPIDPDYPEDRIISMTSDTETHRIITDASDDRRVRLLNCGFELNNIYNIEAMTESGELSSDPVLSRSLTADDPFCCIFTSGSTGRPKGIYIRHGQLRYQMEGYNDKIQTKSDDRILLSSAMVFDLSLCAIFGTIQFGATMVVATREGMIHSPNQMLH